MRILVFCETPPTDARNTSGDQQIYHRLRFLAARHEIIVAYLDWHDGERERVCASDLPYRLKAIGVPPCSEPSPLRPSSVIPWAEGALRGEIETLLSGYQPDLLHLMNLPLLSEVPARTPPVLADWLDIPSRLYRREIKTGLFGEKMWARLNPRTLSRSNSARAAALQKLERKYLARATVILAVSEVDARTLESLAPRKPVRVIRTGSDTDYFKSPLDVAPDPATLLFTGKMDFEPNIEAVEWFCAQVLPRIHERVPDARLVIAGRNPDARVLRLQREQILVTGAVEDMRSYFARATMCIVPLLSGSGTRNKIVEAWAMEKAVVSTHIGAEGLLGTNEKHFLLRDTPIDFARAVTDLLEQPERRRGLGQCGRMLTVREYTLTRAAEQLGEVYADMGRQP